MDEILLVRYGELALKSPPVRREFEAKLRHNLLQAFLAAGVTCTLSADHGHLYVQTADPRGSAHLVQRVFGVTSVSAAEVVASDFSTIAAAVVRAARPRLTKGASFAIRARRTGTHPFTSQQLGADVGGAILDAYRELELKVDLDHPQVELFVEVRANRTYIYVDRSPGPGGLPLGVAGRLGAYVDGVRGALGAYLLMKRGCKVGVLASGEGLELVRTTLRSFDPRLEVDEVDPAQAWARLKAGAEPRHWDGVAVPLEVEAFAQAREEFGDVVVFSPTVGLTDEEVAARWSDVVQLAR